MKQFRYKHGSVTAHPYRTSLPSTLHIYTFAATRNEMRFIPRGKEKKLEVMEVFSIFTRIELKHLFDFVAQILDQNQGFYCRNNGKVVVELQVPESEQVARIKMVTAGGKNK
ncbi:hypothetical protein ACTXT7_002326 [Hymenolepis weldensis]